VRGLKLRALKVLAVEDDVALGDLVALDQIKSADPLSGANVESLHLDAIVGQGIDEVEAAISALLPCRMAAAVNGR